MTLTIKGESELYRRLDALEDVMKRTFWIGVQEDFLDNLNENVKPHNVTGRLERNTYVDLIPNGVEGGIRDSGMMVDWNGRRINYATFVHDGTTDHDIAPNKKKALRWTGPSGRNIFSKGHRVSGITADPFLEDAAKETFKNLEKIFRAELKKQGVT